MKNLGNEAYRKIVIRRGLAVLLAGCMLTASLAACGGKKDKEGDQESSSSSLADVSGAPTASMPSLTASPTPEATAKAVKVKVDDVLNVRKTGDSSGEILGTVTNGTEMALLSDTPQSGWYQVSYKGGIGYVSADYVTVEDVSLEKYNSLKGSSATSEADPSSTSSEDSEGDSSDASDGGDSQASSGNTDSEDGE